MALHDFRCPICGTVQRDVNVPIAIGAAKAEIYCPACSSNPRFRPIEEVGIRMIWIPKVGRMDAGNGPGFTSFDTYDGQNNRVHIGSLGDLRRVERESEQQSRNGEGQPMVWRNYSNDPSNKDQSALHGKYAGGEQPTAEAKAKFGKPLRSATEPDSGYGPGVDDSNTSALGGDDT